MGAAPKVVTPLCDDPLIQGAEAIRQYLGLRSVRQVYALREKGVIPYVDGLGLAARASVLDRIGT